jgi:Leucine-rich repeat (LRR) protein
MSIKNYFSNIQEEIIELIESADEEIVLAVAWFTDEKLFSAILKRARIGVKVFILTLDDEINHSSGLVFRDLAKFGGKVFFQKSSNKSLMHHKFCVFDRRIVVNGSYNWTKKASNNVENITVIIDDTEVVNSYLNEFKKLVPLYSTQVEYDSNYISNTDFNTPERRLNWFKLLSTEWKQELAEATWMENCNSLSLETERSFVNCFKFEPSSGVHLYRNEFCFPNDDFIKKMLSLEEIQLFHKNNLDGLKHLTSLKKLCCHGNNEILIKLDEISILRNLINIEYLDLSCNALVDVSPLKNLLNLKYLNLSDNFIDDLSCLSEHKRIIHFDFSINCMKDLLFIKKWHGIQELRFERNYIEDINPLSGKESLIKIDFESNNIKNIDCLSTCKWLKSLACGANKISNIHHLKNLEYLQYFTFKSNPVTDESRMEFVKYSKCKLY